MDQKKPALPPHEEARGSSRLAGLTLYLFGYRNGASHQGTLKPEGNCGQWDSVGTLSSGWLIRILGLGTER